MVKFGNKFRVFGFQKVPYNLLRYVLQKVRKENDASGGGWWFDIWINGRSCDEYWIYETIYKSQRLFWVRVDRNNQRWK